MRTLEQKKMQMLLFPCRFRSFLQLVGSHFIFMGYCLLSNDVRSTQLANLSVVLVFDLMRMEIVYAACVFSAVVADQGLSAIRRSSASHMQMQRRCGSAHSMAVSKKRTCQPSERRTREFRLHVISFISFSNTRFATHHRKSPLTATHNRFDKFAVGIVRNRNAIFLLWIFLFSASEFAGKCPFMRPSAVKNALENLSEKKVSSVPCLCADWSRPTFQSHEFITEFKI